MHRWALELGAATTLTRESRDGLFSFLSLPSGSLSGTGILLQQVIKLEWPYSNLKYGLLLSI